MELNTTWLPPRRMHRIQLWMNFPLPDVYLYGSAGKGFFDDAGKVFLIYNDLEATDGAMFRVRPGGLIDGKGFFNQRADDFHRPDLLSRTIVNERCQMLAKDLSHLCHEEIESRNRLSMQVLLILVNQMMVASVAQLWMLCGVRILPFFVRKPRSQRGHPHHIDAVVVFVGYNNPGRDGMSPKLVRFGQNVSATSIYRYNL